MKKLISLITALTMTVGFCAISLYAYSYKSAMNDFGQSLLKRFAENTSREKLMASANVLSNFFIARPRAYLRQNGALSSAPDALATSGQIVAADVQGEPMIIDRVPITARIQVVYTPKRISLSFSAKETGTTERLKIAAANRINDS